ncbi:Aminomethyltransferase family protein [Granulibacter bethesdensis]|uniref:Aminomethyltransferase family protein n=1 Tax=Granulibacter bethesdensis TaxID=364410 RepID=A0AAN0REX2_9PROT|nr:Aminomethyltransferase family protein [Granulibacter bethesdensis]
MNGPVRQLPFLQDNITEQRKCSLDIFPADTPTPSRSSAILRGGQWTVLTIPAGGSLMLVNIEGGQTVDLYCLSTASLILPEDASVSPSPDKLAGLVSAQERAGTVLARYTDAELAIMGWRLFDDSTPDKTALSVTARHDAVCVLISAQTVMTPDSHNTATDIAIHITQDETAPRLPAPLAPVKAEIHIPPASARAYTVKAGDYIQIIDVQGKQCSDFLAFDAQSLKNGDLNGLDAAVTRTLTGVANPSPGVHARYFDRTMKPLVEIVQDTVGRHDAFLLACNARYYETQGYPGHTNCTDNFNAVLQDHGIKPQITWPAINFFFNTQVNADGAISLEEPWSRPGDYVLLRAMTDLVCASSACPDDIDPANGWAPTDIHVRIYDASAQFSKGIGHRITRHTEARLTRESGFHSRTSPLAKEMIDYQGFWLPREYSGSGAIEEYWACREKAALFDLTALRKFEITGPDAEKLLNYAVTRDISKLSIGQIVYTALCHPHGGMIDDATVFRMSQHTFRLICGREWCGTWLRMLASEKDFKVWVRSSTDQLHNISLQGPLSRIILSTVFSPYLTQPDAKDLKWFHFSTGMLGKHDPSPVMISRTGYTGELGYEIFCHPQHAGSVWDAVMEAGKNHGLKPAGLDALNMLRIEAGLAFSGYEFCDQTDPFEAGIGFVVSQKKQSDYVGKTALLERGSAYRNRLAGLVIEGNDTVFHGDGVYNGMAQVGIITSPVFSPILGSQIALARIDPSVASSGTKIEIGKDNGMQLRIPAHVVGFPHYDPQKTRVRS